MRLLKFALCALIAVVAVPALGNNIVTNGTFASPVLPPSPGYNVQTPVSQNGDTFITQWGVFGVDAGVFSDPSAPSGFQGAFVDAGSTLYQDVGALSPYTRYTLNLYSQQTGSQPAEVGTLTESLAFGPGNSNSVVNPGSLTTGSTAAVIPASSFAALGPLTFTTGASPTGDLFVVLSTSASGPGPDGARTPQLYIDDVMVSSTPVPEPSSTAFLGISSLALVAYRLARRRRQGAQVPC